MNHVHTCLYVHKCNTYWYSYLLNCTNGLSIGIIKWWIILVPPLHGTVVANDMKSHDKVEFIAIHGQVWKLHILCADYLAIYQLAGVHCGNCIPYKWGKIRWAKLLCFSRFSRVSRKFSHESWTSFVWWCCLSVLNVSYHESFPWKTSLGGIHEKLAQQIFPHAFTVCAWNLAQVAIYRRVSI